MSVSRSAASVSRLSAAETIETRIAFPPHSLPSSTNICRGCFKYLSLAHLLWFGLPHSAARDPLREPSRKERKSRNNNPAEFVASLEEIRFIFVRSKYSSSSARYLCITVIFDQGRERETRRRTHVLGAERTGSAVP